MKTAARLGLAFRRLVVPCRESRTAEGGGSHVASITDHPNLKPGTDGLAETARSTPSEDTPTMNGKI